MENWKDKVVVVAGGSSGLGLAIAKAYIQLGASVVLLARDARRLAQVAEKLNENGVNPATGMVVDATNESAVADAVSEIQNLHGRIDVWINAIGQSIRTSFADAKVADYRQLMEQNFFGSLIASLAALPALEKESGSLVNIGSLASKTAWPFIAPYVTAKHALAGFCHQLRLEGPPNVHFLHVCPGPIRQDDLLPRYAEQAAGLPEAAKKPGAGAPVRGIDPDWLAQKIIWACERKKNELIIPSRSRFLFGLLQVAPWMGDKLIRRLTK